jgi:GT2 family glycosyltransferase
MTPYHARVSVVIPCFNQAQYLGDAIASVLAQTYANVELIVIDDGSTDNTEETASAYPGARLLRQTNRGLAAARNAGLAASRGDYLVFLDSDDRLLPSALESGLKAFARHPACAFVAGGHRMIRFDRTPLWEHTAGPEEDDLYRALLRRNFIAMHAAVMYQRFVFEAVGGFDPRPRGTEDYEMYLRIAKRYPIALHPHIVAEYRVHDSNMTKDAAGFLKSSLLTLRLQRVDELNDLKASRACATGRRFYRRHYGGELAKRVSADLAQRRWLAAAGGAITLLRHQPRGLLSVIR